MKLLQKLRNDVVDSNVELSTALRKAKILATLLEDSEFKSWVDSELKGYESSVELPEYRQLNPPNMGLFIGPFNRSINNYILPTYNLPDSLENFARTMEFRDEVKRIESLIKNAENGTLRSPWPAEAVILASEHIKLTGGYQLVEAWKPISIADLEAILDQVRNRLLDFILQLQEVDPKVLESEEAIQSIPKDTVKNIFNYTIYGNSNIVASGSDFSQSVELSVVQHEKQSLIKYFRNLGVSEEDLGELEKSIELDGKRIDNTFGDKVKGWIGKMTVKAVQGIWKVSLDTAPRLLTEALSKYYGWGS